MHGLKVPCTQTKSLELRKRIQLSECLHKSRGTICIHLNSLRCWIFKQSDKVNVRVRCENTTSTMFWRNSTTHIPYDSLVPCELEIQIWGFPGWNDTVSPDESPIARGVRSLLPALLWKRLKCTALCFHRPGFMSWANCWTQPRDQRLSLSWMQKNSQVVNTFIWSVGIQGMRFCFGQLAVNMYSPLTHFGSLKKFQLIAWHDQKGHHPEWLWTDYLKWRPDFIHLCNVEAFFGDFPRVLRLFLVS